MNHPVLEWLKKKKLEEKYGSGRWYKSSKDFVPSVTTVLNIVSKGPFFHKWLANHLNYEHACQARDVAAERGTLVHELIEDMLDGKEILLDDVHDGPEIIKRIMCFDEWWKNTQIDSIIAKEECLHFPGIRYAGRFDFIAVINGKNCLIDIKTGSYYKTHDIQASMYKVLWDTICEHLGLGQEYMIHKLYGLYLKDSWIKKPNPQFKELKFVPKVVESAVTLWEYNSSNAYGKVIPPKDKEEYPLTFKLEERNANELCGEEGLENLL